jgi:hypothetical protein
MSVALIVLALVFTVGTWTASFGVQPSRGPMLAGLAIGLAGYALLACSRSERGPRRPA